MANRPPEAWKIVDTVRDLWGGICDDVEWPEWDNPGATSPGLQPAPQFSLELDAMEVLTGMAAAMLTHEEMGAILAVAADELAQGRTRFAASLPFVRKVSLIPDRRPVSTWDRSLVLAAGRCRACGSEDDLEVDHIVPVARGGSSERENLQALCGPCNRSKRDKPMAEWLEAR